MRKVYLARLFLRLVLVDGLPLPLLALFDFGSDLGLRVDPLGYFCVCFRRPVDILGEDLGHKKVLALREVVSYHASERLGKNRVVVVELEHFRLVSVVVRQTNLLLLARKRLVSLSFCLPSHLFRFFHSKRII